MASKKTEDWMIPPTVAPVPQGVHRPLWSVMIPTYNCARFLQQTLESVLAQDPGPEQMQIEVIDDCSTNDDPEAVVEQVGKGRVTFYRKPKNEGAIANFNTCIERSRGHLVHILHGDDWVLPGFYEAVSSKAERYGETALFFTRTFVVDEAGQIEYLNERVKELEQPSHDIRQLTYKNRIYTPSVVVRRSAYEQHGAFLPALVHVGDWEMWIRLTRSAGGVCINQPLACYRNFSANDTQRLMRGGLNVDDAMRLSELLKATVSDFDSARFLRMAALTAKMQALRFKALGEMESYRENMKRHRALAWQLGWIPYLKSLRFRF